ncbi:MAG: Eco57I restriction-modification methylase domain-containing protein [Verrucomicrobia bacterium]|nr:Eco57I restriction-modification methylase domain-containing protein [Verrucomicrobiota bacterium]
MAPIQLKPRQALNKAFLKVKPNRADMEGFKAALATLFDGVDPAESEEFHKNLLSDLLKHTGFAPDHFINTKGRNDLVIHNGNDAKTPVGVILEVKSPANAAEMPTRDKLNTKALQELLLYYLRERITLHNLELRHLVVTNVHEWFIFDARVFERCFARDKTLLRLFREFEEKRLAGTKTEHFYKDIAAPALELALPLMEFTHIDLRDLDVQSSTFNVRRSLSPCPPSPFAPADAAIGAPVDVQSSTFDVRRSFLLTFKLLSPTHLLKLPFANDSNSLDRRFYSELLHIIGLAERKQGGKKLIERKPEGERDPGSLLENAIRQLEARDNLAHIPNPKQYGDTREERLFNIALELVITWTNRVLFLKLLEAQLLSYHKGDPAYAFLNYKKIGSYDDLDALFFQVLAREPDARDPEIAARFAHVPYLNSSLFEPSDIEHHGLFVSQLKDRPLALSPGTVLRDTRGKRIEGERDALEYLFTFLDAYDFTSEGTGEIQEDNKTLINASVLGLIFEKINGYRDGSFFTPGFITMYMCRETIRLAVLRKFREAKGWDCQSLTDLKDRIGGRIEERQEANDVINALKICDPAVGSGHFLVSALNEIIALKSELGLLCDRQGLRLKNYHVEVVHDELFITDEDGDFFEYKPALPESQRVQEALFHEKQTLIENCLFGVDLNPNSVKICRLRLWIELLKHAYYKSENQLETLPNIDINIKCGNSLISRFDLDSDLKTALRKSKWTIDGYRVAVMSYRNAQTKEQKRKMRQLINDIKGDFEAEIHANDPRVRRKNKLTGRLNELTLQTRLFEQTPKEKAAWNKEVKKLTADIGKLDHEIETIRGNRIFENAFEWRFEFPEVLDNEGAFIGFDAVIGNPPYVQIQSLPADIKEGLANGGYQSFGKTADLYCLFFERALRILKPHGVLTFITSNKFYRAAYGKALRKLLADELTLRQLIDFGDAPVFEAIAYASILLGEKVPPPKEHKFPACTWLPEDDFENLDESLDRNGFPLRQSRLTPDAWRLENPETFNLLEKIQTLGTPLGEYVNGNLYYGIKTGLNDAFVIDQTTRDQLIAEDPNSADLIKPYLRGRDVKKWSPQPVDLYLIKIESSENTKHPWSDLPLEEAEGIFRDTYPAISARMTGLEWKERLIKRADQGKYYWELRSCAYWKEFEKPKVIIPAITSRPELAADLNGFYSNNKTTIVICSEPYFISAVCNSCVGLWFAKKVFATKQNDSNDYEPRYSSQFPIPPTTDAQKAELIALAEQCAQATESLDSSHLLTLESSIDKVVCCLFDLTTEEEVHVKGICNAIRSETDNLHDHKHILQKKVIPSLIANTAYFSYDSVWKSITRTVGKEPSPSTLRHYLSDCINQGILYDAGKGWYSSLSEPLTFPDAAVEKPLREITKRLPMLSVSAWSTEWINPYMHHLLSKSFQFVSMERDAMNTVAELLLDAGYEVLVHPDRETFHKLTSRMHQPLVLYPSLSRAPTSQDGIAPPEKWLIDLLIENERLALAETEELQQAVNRLLCAGRIQMSELVSYARRRNLALAHFECINSNNAK